MIYVSRIHIAKKLNFIGKHVVLSNAYQYICATVIHLLYYLTGSGNDMASLSSPPGMVSNDNSSKLLLYLFPEHNTKQCNLQCHVGGASRVQGFKGCGQWTIGSCSNAYNNTNLSVLFIHTFLLQILTHT